MAASISLLGSTPASESLLAFTRTMNRIALSLLDGDRSADATSSGPPALTNCRTGGGKSTGGGRRRDGPRRGSEARGGVDRRQPRTGNSASRNGVSWAPPHNIG